MQGTWSEEMCPDHGLLLLLEKEHLLYPQPGPRIIANARVISRA